MLRGARIDIGPGEFLGLVGQSGSGKTTLALAILQLLAHTGARLSGRILLLGKDLVHSDEGTLRDIRGRLISLIPQSPTAALNPVLRIGTQLAEAWRAHSHESWSSQRDRIRDLFEMVGLSPPDSFLTRLPSEISVGQGQRVLIVMALLHSPPLLIADEPTSALDAITQREILDLLSRIGEERRMSILLISHDLLSVATFCHRVAILHQGEIVESGPVDDVLNAPQHPYTRRLIATLPPFTK